MSIIVLWLFESDMFRGEIRRRVADPVVVGSTLCSLTGLLKVFATISDLKLGKLRREVSELGRLLAVSFAIGVTAGLTYYLSSFLRITLAQYLTIWVLLFTAGGIVDWLISRHSGKKGES